MARAYMRHALQAGYCRSGVKRWMLAYGIDPKEAIGPQAPGIETSRLRALGGRFLKVADLAEQEAARGQE